MPTPGDPIAAFFAALNTRDWPAFRELWTDDAVLSGAGDVDCRGADAVVAYYRDTVEPWSSYRETLRHVVGAGEAVAAVADWSGATHDGVVVHAPVVEVFEPANGRLRALTTWHGSQVRPRDAAVCRLAREYFAAVNAEAWESLADTLHEDAELHGVGGPPRLGRGAIVEGIKRFMSRFAEHHDEPVRIVPSGSTVTVEIAFTGTSTNGRRVAFPALDVFDIDRGRIRRIRNWLDLDDIRRQSSAEPA